MADPTPADIHTGDDDLLDELTSARAALESIDDDPDVDRDEAIADALDSLAKADALRVAELRARPSAAPPASPDLNIASSAKDTIWTSEPPISTPTIAFSPYAIEITGPEPGQVFRQHYDGTTECGPGYTPDAAAERFWTCLKGYFAPPASPEEPA